MKLRYITALIISKASIIFLRAMHYGATSLPGKIALTIYPDIIKEIPKTFTVIAVTGTNGKTTTSRIIGQILEESNIGYISNKSGANMLNGIITSYIDAISLKGKSQASFAVFEIDEAFFDKAAEYIRPHITIVTNFFQDQIERYGGIENVLNHVISGIQKIPESILILNADDPFCASIGKNASNNTIYYGISPKAYNGPSDSALNDDSILCIYCKSTYEYLNHTYGHLGGFICPKCGYSRPETTVTCKKIIELNENYSFIMMDLNETISYATIKLPALYNIYNALAAAACGVAIGAQANIIVRALSSFELGFGRMETIEADKKIIKIILVKNSVGLSQVLDYILNSTNNNKFFSISFIINNYAADGKDVSWLWNTNIEKLNKVRQNIIKIYISGTKGDEMEARLKQAGFEDSKINHVKDYKTLINLGLEEIPQGGTFYILPTYTAMLDIRKILKNRFGLKEFWE